MIKQCPPDGHLIVARRQVPRMTVQKLITFTNQTIKINNYNSCIIVLVSQIEDKPQLPVIILYWCSKKLLFKGKGKIIRSGASAIPLIEEDLQHLSVSDFHVGLQTKGSEYICIDIDSPSVSDSFIRLLQDFNVLILRTPRGGIHIYFKKPETYALYYFGNTYRVTQLGVVVEFKSEYMVITLGPGYTIIASPTSSELDVIPDYLFPLPWTPGKTKFRNRKLIREEIIKEGFRNQFLFEWSAFMFQNPRAFVVPRDTVVRLLAEYFCLPPMTDENEIMNLIHVENRVESNLPTESEDHSVEPSAWVEAFFSNWKDVDSAGCSREESV